MASNVVSTLPSQILEVLRDQSMSFTQLSTYYSIKYRSSLNERLKGARAANLKEYLEGLENIFEVQGDTVKARPKKSEKSTDSEEPAIATIRYAHISKGIQNILNETQSKSMDISDLETTFKTRFNVALVSVIGMPTVEYLQRKSNVFQIEDNVVQLQSAFQKETELKTKEAKKGGLSPISEDGDAEKPSKGRQAWADLPVVPEPSDLGECRKSQPEQKMSNGRNDDAAADGLLNSLRSAPQSGSTTNVTGTAPVTQAEVQPKVKNDVKKQESKDKQEQEAKDKKVQCENLPLFAVDELVRIFDEHSEGPIMHSSVLCSLFMQQLGASVTEISGKKPMELFRQHPEAFIWLSSGNVALAKYRHDKAVQHELKLLEDQPKSVRVKAAAQEASLPVPENVTEEDVVNYMIGLLQENEDRDSIYISALCGRFMQRFRKPVTEIVGCKPTEFLKKHSELFYLEKGGHVKLVKGAELTFTGVQASVESLTVSDKGAAVQKEEKPPLSTAQPANQTQGMPVTVPPPVRPWRRNAPETEKENLVAASAVDQQKPSVSQPAGIHENAEVQQKIDDFCTRLRKQLFFRVAEVTSGAPIQAPGGSQGRPAEIPITVKVTSLPKELEARWLPQLLSGLQQVLELKFDEVDGIAEEGEGIHCRLRNFNVGLFLRLAVV